MAHVGPTGAVCGPPVEFRKSLPYNHMTRPHNASYGHILFSKGEMQLRNEIAA